MNVHGIVGLSYIKSCEAHWKQNGYSKLEKLKIETETPENKKLTTNALLVKADPFTKVGNSATKGASSDVLNARQQL